MLYSEEDLGYNENTCCVLTSFVSFIKMQVLWINRRYEGLVKIKVRYREAMGGENCSSFILNSPYSRNCEQ